MIRRWGVACNAQYPRQRPNRRTAHRRHPAVGALPATPQPRISPRIAYISAYCVYFRVLRIFPHIAYIAPTAYISAYCVYCPNRVYFRVLRIFPRIAYISARCVYFRVLRIFPHVAYMAAYCVYRPNRVYFRVLRIFPHIVRWLGLSIWLGIVRLGCAFGLGIGRCRQRPYGRGFETYVFLY